jgi:histidine ammonia-lyase
VSVSQADEQPIRIDGANLSVADIAALAARSAAAELDPAARDRAVRSHEFAVRVSAQRPVYGRSTGVGANRDVVIDDPDRHALALLRSHATTAGPLREPQRVRAMVAVRLNQLAAGGSGVSPLLLDGLADMLAADALPPVRELGSIGTADLSALALVALALMGEAPTSTPLHTRYTCAPQDAVSIMNSNAGAIADAALAQHRLTTLARAAVVVAGLTFVLVDGNAEAFAPLVETASPFDGVRHVCAWMRSLVGDAGPPARIQDPFGLRALPQVHGALLDALARGDEVVTRMANAPSENPSLVPDVGVAHHGAWHAAYLSQAMDAVVSAAAQSAQLGLARLSMLSEPAFTGLAPFLGDGTPGASGVMITEYVAADALGGLRALATPTGVQTVSLSRGVEEDASFASLAARHALAAVDDYRTLVACELVAAVRGLRLRGRDAVGLAECAALPDQVADRALTEDILTAEQLLPALAALLHTRSTAH